jgi:starch-binding outer membrane protein, SusD/RagB family
MENSTMKNIIALTLTIMSMMFVTSCGDSFLDEEVKSSFAPESLADPLGFDASVVGLHRHYSYFHTMSENQGYLCVWQVGTDIAWGTQPVSWEIPYFRYAELSSTDAASSFTWNWAFKLIKNANIIIDNAENPAVTVTQEEKDAFNAEARFFRALGYNMLVTLFGDVPLITEPITTPKTDFVRAPVSEIDALIEEDLLFAATHLPDVDHLKKPSRINKAAAQQLLAEAYLRMDRPADAEAQCMEVINSGKFSLVKNRYGVKTSVAGDAFSDMFRVGNQRRAQGNTEVIWNFEIYNRRDIPNSIAGDPQQRRVWGCGYHNIAGMVPADSLGGRGLSRMRLNNWVLHGLYDDGDMRNSRHSIKREFWYTDPTKATFGQKVNPAPADTLLRMHPYTLKWGQYDPLDVFGYAMWKDLPLMRLGETYLLLAEAQFKQNHPDQAAISINELRTRAQAPTVDAGDITLDFILDERVRELVGEENRRLTLMRTGTLVDRIKSRNPPVGNSAIDVTGISVLEGGAKLLLPIPQSERDLNKDADLKQNTGY